MTHRTLMRRIVLCTLLSAATTAEAQEKAPATLEVVSIADGATRQIAQLNGDDRLPVWSPDSRRVALRTVQVGVTGIAVMNADGSGRRDFATANAMLTSYIRWSPDGRFVAFLSDGGHAHTVLDVTTGVARTLASAASANPFRRHAFEWTPDSRGIRYVNMTDGPTAPSTSVREARLDGTDRELANIDRYLPARRFHFVADTLVMVVIVTKDTTFVVPASGASAKRFPTAGSWNPGFSLNGDLIASAYAPPGDPHSVTAVELLSTRDGTRRVLSLPFEVMRVGGKSPLTPDATPMLLPDGKHLVVSSVASAGQPKRLWFLSADAEPPRVIATCGDGTDHVWLDLSPDGRNLVLIRPTNATDHRPASPSSRP
jgi:hypothetical protein